VALTHKRYPCAQWARVIFAIDSKNDFVWLLVEFQAAGPHTMKPSDLYCDSQECRTVQGYKHHSESVMQIYLDDYRLWWSRGQHQRHGFSR